MLSVKAKLDWVPFGSRLQNKTLKKDIDFDMIQFKIPIATDLFGYYRSFEYQLTEESL